MENNQKEEDQLKNEVLDEILYKYADEMLSQFDEDKNDILDKNEIRRAILAKFLTVKSGGDGNHIDENALD